MPRALVVDDDRSSLAALAELIELEGFCHHHGRDAGRGARPTRRAVSGRGSHRSDAAGRQRARPPGGSPGRRAVRGHHRTRQRRHRGGGAAQRRGGLPDQAGRSAAAEDHSGQRQAHPRAAGGDRHRCATSCASSAASARWSAGPRPMERVYDLISKVAPTDATVLHRRRKRHRQGGRGAGPAPAEPASQGRRFVPVNCGAVSPNADRERAVRPREGAASPAPSALHRGDFEQAAAARCSSTRSPRCRWSCRSSCCACWKPAR